MNTVTVRKKQTCAVGKQTEETDMRGLGDGDWVRGLHEKTGRGGSNYRSSSNQKASFTGEQPLQGSKGSIL